MTINRYFNLLGQKVPNQETDLVRGWVKEAIQINGFDLYYIVRDTVKLDKLFGEDVLSNFKTNYKIEAYLETSGGFEGPGDVLKQMGSIVSDQCTIQVQRERFQEQTTMEYPKEGDLIFFPEMFNRGVWEIKFVEDEQQFYPTGSRISFKMKLELFDLSGETFNTGIANLDKRMGDFAPVKLQTLTELEDVLKSDNKQIQTESDAIVDTTQSSIFGKF
jgi:hypothetical protein